MLFGEESVLLFAMSVLRVHALLVKNSGLVRVI